MIKLTGNSPTTIQYLSGGTVDSSVVTDTLYIKSVTVDFSSGAMYAHIARGSTDANGFFFENYPAVDLVVNPDGSFISSDGKWKGSVSSAPSLVAQLQAEYDAFITSSGLITGTSVPNK